MPDAPAPGTEVPSSPVVAAAPETAPVVAVVPPEAAPVVAPVVTVPEVKTAEPVVPAAARPSTAAATAKLLAQRAKVRGEKEALAASQKKLDAERGTFTTEQQKLAQVAELSELMAKDPVEAARRLAGGDEHLTSFMQRLTDSIVSGGTKAPTLSKEDREQLNVVKQLQEEIASLKKTDAERTAQLKAEQLRYEAQQLEYQAGQYLDAGWKELGKTPDDFELVSASEPYKARVEQRVIEIGTKKAQEAQALGRKPVPLITKDFVEAAREVQSELEKELEPLLATKRIRAKFAPAPAVTAAPGVDPGTTRTVTTEGRGDPPVSPDWANLSVDDRLYLFSKGIKPRA